MDGKSLTYDQALKKIEEEEEKAKSGSSQDVDITNSVLMVYLDERMISTDASGYKIKGYIYDGGACVHRVHTLEYYKMDKNKTLKVDECVTLSCVARYDTYQAEIDQQGCAEYKVGTLIIESGSFLYYNEDKPLMAITLTNTVIHGAIGVKIPLKCIGDNPFMATSGDLSGCTFVIVKDKENLFIIHSGGAEKDIPISDWLKEQMNKLDQFSDKNNRDVENKMKELEREYKSRHMLDDALSVLIKLRGDENRKTIDLFSYIAEAGMEGIVVMCNVGVENPVLWEKVNLTIYLYTVTEYVHDAIFIENAGKAQITIRSKKNGRVYAVKNCELWKPAPK